jgi:hypothetical protein
VGRFRAINFEGRAGFCVDSLVACIVDDEGVIPRGNGDRYDICSRGREEDCESGRSGSGISHVVCFDGVYTLTIRDEWPGIGINLLHMRAVIASSSSKVEDGKDRYCNDRNAAQCSAYGRRNDGAVTMSHSRRSGKCIRFIDNCIVKMQDSVGFDAVGGGV